MSLLTFDLALAQLLDGAQPLTQIESLATFDAAGRVLARPQTSAIDVPPLDNSSMDGYAVRCADVPATGTRLALTQRIPAGSVGHSLAPGTAARIFTGAPVPPGVDAIVMQEMCARDGDDDLGNAGAPHVTINHVPQPGDWIRRAGEDIRAGARFCRRHAADAAATGTGGLGGDCALPVSSPARGSVFHRRRTGDAWGGGDCRAAAGAIYNSNRYLLRGLLQQLGCAVGDFGIVPDNLPATRAALREAAAGHDLILSSGGVSVGEEDHVRPAVQAEGELALWKIAIKPGKPLAFGHVGTGSGRAAFIGLPGNPVSSFVTFLMLVRPFILKAQGDNAQLPSPLSLRADFDWARPDARREFLRARRNPSGGLDLFANQSSGVLTSAAWADGLVDNPPGQAIRRGDTLSFLPFSELLY